MLGVAGAQLPRVGADSVALLPASPVSITSTGASVAVIDSAMIAASGARTLSELLLARVPGLSVRHQGGTEADGFEISSRGMRRLAVRVVGQDLLTWTEYEGSDPEVAPTSFDPLTAPAERFQAPLPRRVRVAIRMGVI